MNDSYDISKSFQRIEERLIKSLKVNLMKHLNEEKLEDMRWTAWQTEQLKSLELFTFSLTVNSRLSACFSSIFIPLLYAYSILLSILIIA